MVGGAISDSLRKVNLGFCIHVMHFYTLFVAQNYLHHYFSEILNKLTISWFCLFLENTRGLGMWGAQRM